MKRWAALAAIVLAAGVLAGCHNSDQVTAKWYYFQGGPAGQSECFGVSSIIRMGAPSWNTRLRGWNFYHVSLQSPYNQCETPSGLAANTQRVENNFHKLDIGVCDYGPIDWNASGAPAGVEWFPSSCGNGHYYAASHAATDIGQTFVYGAVNSITDPYCDGVNPGCP